MFKYRKVYVTNSYHSYGYMKKENRKLLEKSLTLGSKSKWPFELTGGFKNKSNEDCCATDFIA